MGEQPRVPAGSPKGGQFGSKGGGGGGGAGLPGPPQEVREDLEEGKRQSWDAAINDGNWKEDSIAELGQEGYDAFLKENPDQATYEENIRKALQKTADNSDPAMNVPLDVLTGQINKDGSFKGASETGASGATKESHPDHDEYMKSRVDAEAQLFSLGKDAAPSSRPKYGYLIDKDHQAHLKESKGSPVMEAYGDATVVFKSSVRGRTTITEMDSLDSQGARLPSPMNKVTHHSVSTGSAVYEMKGVLDSTRSGKPLTGYAYHEAQYHGKISTKDIKHVYVSKPPSLEQTLRLDKMAKADGFDWSVAP